MRPSDRTKRAAAEQLRTLFEVAQARAEIGRKEAELRELRARAENLDAAYMTACRALDESVIQDVEGA